MSGRNKIALSLHQRSLATSVGTSERRPFEFQKKVLVFSMWCGVFLAVLLAGLGGAMGALAQEMAPADVSIPRLAHETRGELLALGCEEVDLTNKPALMAARSLGWQMVLPADATDQAVMLCAPAVVTNLQPLREGQVAADADWQDRVSSFNMREAFKGSDFSIVGMLNSLSEVGKSVLSTMIVAIPALLTIGTFLRHEFVITAWPFALGIANLGFMLALVVIALMVTLRLDDGGGVKRMLPRFLLGALLVNFSLIIGVAIIDVARLASAATMNVMGYNGPSDLVKNFKDTIDIGPTVKSLGVFFGEMTNRWTNWTGLPQIVAAIIIVLIVWSLAGAALVVYVGLLIRYYALLLLLVISPFAYLFVAFPNTVNLAKLWWKTFFKYVFYGPAVLVVLIAGVIIANEDSLWQNIELLMPDGTSGTTKIDKNVMRPLIRTGMVAVGMMLAASAGRWAGIVGSAATMNMVSKAGARGKGMFLGGLRTAGRTATAPVRFGWKQAKESVGAYTGGKWQALKERYGVDTKSLAARGRARVEQRYEQPALKPLHAKSAGELRRGNDAVAAANTNPLTLTAAQLGNRYIGARVAREVPNAIVTLAADADSARGGGEELRALQLAIRSKAVMGELNDQQKSRIAINLDINRDSRGGRLPDAVVDRLQTELQKTISAGPTGPTDNP